MNVGSYFLVGVALGSIGCAVNILDDATGGGGRPAVELVNTHSEAATACDERDILQYSVLGQQQIPVVAGTEFCWMSSMRGDSPGYTNEGYGHPWSYVVTNGGPSAGWAAGIGPTYGMEVEVTCTRLACFHSNGGSNDVRWVSSNTRTDASGLFTGCKTGTTNLWLGDAASILTGLDIVADGFHELGRLWSTSDRSQVVQNADTNAASQLKVRDCYWADGATGARAAIAVSLFVGVPGGDHVPMFRGPNASRAGIAAAGEYTSQSWDSTSTVNMGWVDEGICYFASLSGQFLTFNDKAQIFPVYVQSAGRYRWKLRTTKTSGSNDSTSGIKATARCYWYDQSQ